MCDASGYRKYDNGFITYMIGGSYYMSSSPYSNGVFIGTARFYGDALNSMVENYRSYAFSVRCVQELHIIPRIW